MAIDTNKGAGRIVTAVASGSRTSPVRRPKPDSATAMRLLIAQVRDAIPFDLPAAQLCIGECDGCSVKLLEFLASELDGWDARLDAGERPGLKELSRLVKTSRKVHAVLARNGLVQSSTESSAK